jgi:hypothetical protein
VLFVHEVHSITGDGADEFDRLYRDEWLPTIAEQGDARLLWYLHQAHGAGPAYTAITITGVASADAWSELDGRIRAGDLHDLDAATDALRHDHVAKVLVPAPFSALQDVDLDTVPTSAPDTDRPSSLFMEDTAWPHRGKFDDYLAKAGTLYVETLQRSSRGILDLVAAFTPAFGAGRHREVVLWQRVRSADALLALLTFETPPEYRVPGTWMHDALQVRDRWESRLLRTTGWSPLA